MKCPVKPALKIATILTVIVTLLAWFAISNHCALGRIVATAETKATPNECPFHSKHSQPAKQKQQSNSPCCKILRATAPSPAKNFARSILDLVDIDFAFAKWAFVAPPKI